MGGVSGSPSGAPFGVRQLDGGFGGIIWQAALVGRDEESDRCRVYGVGRHRQVCCGAVWAEAQSFVVLARAGKLVVPDFAGANFAQVVVAEALPPPPVTQDRIELFFGSMTVRLDAATDLPPR